MKESEKDANVICHDIVIVGGGTAGISVAARLTKGWGNKTDVAIIDPSESHYYQPAWTLVGAGTFRQEATRRSEASVIPKKAKWIQDAVVEFDPEHNRLRTREGRTIQYKYLIVAAGIQIHWDQVKGLKENVGSHGICSNYSFQTVGYTWECLRGFQGGTAIFTQPQGAVKCGGAPQKICYLAEDYFRKQGLREETRVIFASPGKAIFAVQKYREVLEKVVQRKGIDTMFQHNLIAVSPETKEAIFQNVETGEEVSIHYDMIHVTPPQGPPEFIAKSPLASDAGWVDLNPDTLQHVRFSNVFGLGDSSNLPTSKTGAAIRKQAPVVVKNVQSLINGRPMSAKYSGYTSCPVVTGYGTLVLAEFDYGGNPAETFPFNQAKERWSMWLLKKYGLPFLYWHGMLKGL
ncbi:MAG: NAD(P)/FAD-dependent oxidoreductase [Planctomycetaceae bacterium]|nr:NAD(P)/FAD-dependent oxidoreductase [Planctomycetaceae bacterium]